jgi:hypothetical protein
MDPYRTASPPARRPAPPDGGDDRLLLTVNLVIALLRLIPALVSP